MGFVIVPTQLAFGFNYLGGKLLKALCVVLMKSEKN